MNDFEVNPRGYAEEIKLSRDLANKIIDNYDYSQLHPDVVSAIMKLLSLYEKQKEEGIM